MQLAYTHITSSNHILVITMGEPSNLSIATMNPRVGSRKYLVTYFQVDESKFSTRESFGKMLEAEFGLGLVPERSTRMIAFTIIRL